MLGSPTPVGKRPDFKQAQSGGMGWPRLVPVKDQQAQKAPTIDTSQTRRSSASPPAKDANDSAISPTTADKPTSEPPAPAQSPVLSPAGASLPGSLAPDTPAPVEDPQSQDASGNMFSSIGSYIANQAQDILKPEEAESSAQGAVSNAPEVEEPSVEEPSVEEPSETPIPEAVEQVIHVLTDSVPYYAKPKITVQKPSQSDISDISAPRPIDEVLAEERLVPMQESLPQPGGLSSVPPIPAPDWQLPDVQGPVIEVPGVSAPEVPKVPKMKKSSKAVRQTRRIAGRETILKVLLGRQLAKPTKQALKSLAKGEDINLDKLAVPAV